MKKLFAAVAVSCGILAVPALAQPTTGYTLKVEAPPIKKGGKAIAKIEIMPGAGYHMNKEYPTSLVINNVPAGVTVDKVKYTMNDATRWDAEGGEFDVPYSASQTGKKVVTGELKFAVCSANTCDPKKSAVSIEVVTK